MQNNLNKIRQKAKRYYKTIASTYCPYFKERVVFTSEGFNHIRYRTKNKKRHIKVREIRYKLLDMAPKVISYSNTLQEYDLQNLLIRIQRNKTKKKISKKVQFFGFIAIINGWKIKVIVRQVGNGKKHFWSIIPNWKTRKSIEGKNLYQNYTGNLDKD